MRITDSSDFSQYWFNLYMGLHNFENYSIVALKDAGVKYKVWLLFFIPSAIPILLFFQFQKSDSNKSPLYGV